MSVAIPAGRVLWEMERGIVKGLLASLGMFGVMLAGMWGIAELTVIAFSQVNLPTSLEGATSLTSMGFAIWYGWYVTTKAIPRIIDQHSEQLVKTELSHSKRVEQLASDFREELRATRETFRCDNRPHRSET